MAEEVSKTQESIETKGDKSYYYWHGTVKNTVPIAPPPLLRTETVSAMRRYASNVRAACAHESH
jgi:hypothetical protein